MTVSHYSALSSEPNRTVSNRPDFNIYRKTSPMTFGKFKYQSPAQGRLSSGERETNGDHSMETFWSNEFEIAWSMKGDKGPLVLFIHGVPCNRAQWEDVQHLISPFARTINIDMLGMGESSKPREYGTNLNTAVHQALPDGKACQWDWINDVDYVEKLMQHYYPGERFFIIADDWGGGIASHYAAQLNHRLLGLILLDTIAFDGYPVNEIQAVGRAAMLPNTPEGDQLFKQVMGNFDQVVTQIIKGMTYIPGHVYNQYVIRRLTFPYIDQDYARNGKNDGVSDVFNPWTARLNYHNLRVLAERSAALSPSQLLPYHPQYQPRGVKYEQITVPSLIMWGEFDTMMPAAQIHRFANVLGTDDVTTLLIPRSGHFAHTDQPIKVAEQIIDFTRRVVGRANLGDIFLGYQGIWKGDEWHVISQLRDLVLAN